MDEISIPKGAVKVPGQTADAAKQQEVLETAHWQRVGKVAEKLNDYAKLLGQDYNLTEEETAQAIYLEVLNWKEFWPDALGGPAKFDELSKEVWSWFQANKDK